MAEHAELIRLETTIGPDPRDTALAALRAEVERLRTRALPDDGEYLCFTRGTFERAVEEQAVFPTSPAPEKKETP